MSQGCAMSERTMLEFKIIFEKKEKIFHLKTNSFMYFSVQYKQINFIVLNKFFDKLSIFFIIMFFGMGTSARKIKLIYYSIKY